ncbi:hypothetical protein MNV49_007595 [Pseudohyphozyma bogoriensis]|nr:hypothetical protein MNV49_007595 [Pseudohyphozyma bogoriensis]
MQRDLLKSKLPQLPALSPEGDELEELEEEELDSFPASLARAAPPPRRTIQKGKDYSPISASSYFSEALEVNLATPSTSVFRVYYTPAIPSKAPIESIPSISDSLGAGPAKAPWLKSVPTSAEDEGKGVLVVCVHGAGYSALSFACLAKALKEKSNGRAGVLSYDQRGHGKTKMSAEDEESMSIENLSKDLVDLLKTMFPDKDDAPTILLVGHSMGGSVATHAAPLLEEHFAVTGLVVIDVVEGTALEALSSMSSIIESRPTTFQGVEKAIEWHLRTKTIQNPTSARISVPSLFIPSSSATSTDSTEVVWRSNLLATSKYWEGWFQGLSSKFLACRTAKLLLLAGSDRLDKELLVGQMQGKYQLEVFNDVGHCVMEDAPEKTADLLLMFWRRNDRTDILKGVKKVGQV